MVLIIHKWNQNFLGRFLAYNPGKKIWDMLLPYLPLISFGLSYGSKKIFYPMWSCDKSLKFPEMLDILPTWWTKPHILHIWIELRSPNCKYSQRMYTDWTYDLWPNSGYWITTTTHNPMMGVMLVYRVILVFPPHFHPRPTTQDPQPIPSLLP